MSSVRHDQPVLAMGRLVLGIDIGKYKHAATILSAQGEVLGSFQHFDNTRAGIDRMEAKLCRPHGLPNRILVAMEATGHYWMPLYYELERRGYICVVINPIQTNAKLRCRIRKTKTDRLDSLGIAQFILTGEAKTARVPPEKTVELRLLVRHRWRLVQLLANTERVSHTYVDRIFPEFESAFCKPFITSGKTLIREIGLDPATIVEQEKEVRALLKRSSRGQLTPETVDELLGSAQHSIGIGEATDTLNRLLRSNFAVGDALRVQIDAIDAELEERVKVMNSPLTSLGLKAPLVATIHAESDPISDFRHPWQYAAYAGLDPAAYISGEMHGTHTHISKRGSPYLRHALYLSAFTLYRRHTDLFRCYQRHSKRSRSHTDAIVCVAHKLARIIWRLLTDNRPFRKTPPKKPH